MRYIRQIEIPRQFESDHPRSPDCHIGIAGKIKIYLQRIGYCSQQDRYTSENSGSLVNLIDKNRQTISQNELLEQSENEYLNSFGQ